MRRTRRNKLVAAAAGLLAVVFTAAALAQTGVLSRSEESEAVVNDAAEQLGVEPAALSDALKQALKNRVDAAVEAGRLTQEQGAEMKARIDASEVPLLGLGHGHGLGHHGHFGGLDAAATYLGLTEEELRTSLGEGKTLAEVAKERDKAVDGLVGAMVAAAKEDIDQAVEDGRLTDAKRKEILSTLEARITEKVNSQFRGGPGGPGRGDWGPPPSDSGSDSGSGASGSSSSTATAA